MSALPTPSEEQLEVIRAFSAGYNVKIEAVAGAGKSTTLLWLCLVAKRDFGAPCLLLTYNKMLQMEVQSKLQQVNLESFCAVYTYHGFASKIFSQSIHTDVALRSCLDRNISSTLTIPNIILVDEVQDLNEDYVRLINRILGHGKILILVGDRRQCINEYTGASAKYLTEYFNYFSTGRPWKELSLRTSYRLTPSTARFINTHVLNDNLIIGGNTTNPNLLPLYWYNVYNLKHAIEKMAAKYGPDEVALLTPSVRNVGNPRSPLGRLMNSKSNVLLAVIDDSVSPDSIKGKVIISSFHSFKGRERNCIFVVNFDESYFDFYHRDWSRESKEIPNIIYVAATRAREQLIIVQGDKNLPLRTVKMDELPHDCKVIGSQSDLRVINPKDRNTKVTDLIRHRHLDDITAMLGLMTIQVRIGPGTHLSNEEMIQFPGYIEDVRSFYGILIPVYYEYQALNVDAIEPIFPTWLNRILQSVGAEAPVYNDLLDLVEYFPPGKNGFADVCARLNTLLNLETKSLYHWMEIVVLCTALENRWHFYKDQITHYKWVNTKFIEEGVERLSKILPGGGEYERYYLHHGVEGIADYVTSTSIWELKCTSTLTEEHKIQLGAYLALHFLTTGAHLTGQLYNIKTEELLEITVTDPIAYLAILNRRNAIIPAIEATET